MEPRRGRRGKDWGEAERLYGGTRYTGTWVVEKGMLTFRNTAGRMVAPSENRRT